MRKIVEYKTLGDNLSAQLDIKINKAIEEGWQPWGNLSLSKTHGDNEFAYVYCQAMVKYEKSRGEKEIAQIIKERYEFFDSLTKDKFEKNSAEEKEQA